MSNLSPSAKMAEALKYAERLAKLVMMDDDGLYDVAELKAEAREVLARCEELRATD